jgi:hypothetical protein
VSGIISGAVPGGSSMAAPVFVAGVPNQPNVFYIGVCNGGVWKTTDGGRTFERVLYKDENTGGNDVAIDPSNPQIVYATLGEARQGPWGHNGAS